MSLDWIYWAISWILLRWHEIWDAVGVPTTAVLGTNWAWILAIVFLVVTVRAVLFPLFVKQIKSQRAMQAVQPRVKELQEKHKGDRETLQKEVMELYRKEKANPLMGCLPLLLQLPVFFGLFHVLRRLDPAQTENTDLYGWTTEQFQQASVARLFDAPISSHFTSTAADLASLGAESVTVKLVAGILVAIMIGTTYLTSRQMILKTGWAEDPQQKMIQRLMLYGIPASLLISGGIFPIGVIIYWVTNNLISLAQQQWVLRKYPPPPMPGRAGAVLGKSATAARATAGKNGTAGKPAAKVAKGKPGGKTGSATTAPTIDGRALAPKPGAKPVHPKKRKAANKRPAG